MSRTPLSHNEKEFLLAALHSDQRVDGRHLLDSRRVRISFPGECGTAEAVLGGTRVLAVVSGELVEPYPERATEGFFVFSAELSALCSERFKENERATRWASLGLSRLLERTLRDSNALDVESLCVVAGVRVWSIRVDVHVLDHDGNLIDASCLAAAAALQHYRRPEVSVDNGLVCVLPAHEREPVPLSLHHVPLTVTFALYSEGALVVLDPLVKEEDLSDCRLTIAANVYREVCLVDKAGGQALSPDVLLSCADLAIAKVHELHDMLAQALAAEAARASAQRRGPAPSRPGAYVYAPPRGE